MCAFNLLTWNGDLSNMVKITASGTIVNKSSNSLELILWGPDLGSLHEYDGMLSAWGRGWTMGRLFFFLHLKRISLTGRAVTDFRDWFHSQSLLVQALASFRFKSTAVANLYNNAATWLHVDPNPATQEQLPVKTHPSEFRHTHTM